MTRAEVYKLIDGERDYQELIWAGNRLLPGEFLLLIEEYCARGRAAWTAEPKPEPQTMDIIRKIAGIAVNALEQHGARPRDK